MNKCVFIAGAALLALAAIGACAATWTVDDKYYEVVEGDATNVVQHTWEWAVSGVHSQSWTSHFIELAYDDDGQTQTLSTVTFTNAVVVDRIAYNKKVRLTGTWSFEQGQANGLMDLDVEGTVQFRKQATGGIINYCTFKPGSVLEANSNRVSLADSTFFSAEARNIYSGTVERCSFSNSLLNAACAFVNACSFIEPRVQVWDGYLINCTNSGSYGEFGVGDDIGLNALPMPVALAVRNGRGSLFRNLTIVSNFNAEGHSMLFRDCAFRNMYGGGSIYGSSNTIESCSVYSNQNSMTIQGDANSIVKSCFGTFVLPNAEYNDPPVCGGGSLWLEGTNNTLGKMYDESARNIFLGASLGFAGENNTVAHNYIGMADISGRVVYASGGINSISGPGHTFAGNVFIQSGLTATNADNLVVATNWFGTYQGARPGITHVGLSAGGSANAQIRGNTFLACGNAAIYLAGSHNAQISGNNIGYDPKHDSLAGNGWTSSGYVPQAGIGAACSTNLSIKNNLIVGGGSYGIFLTGEPSVSAEKGCDGTVIQGNRIGCWQGRSESFSNRYSGIMLYDVEDILIGGTAEGEGNVIGGNGEYGILAGGESGSGSSYMYCKGLSICGNHIGADFVDGGWSNVGNGRSGIMINGFGYHAVHHIGDPAEWGHNIIGHNRENGVWLYQVYTTGTFVNSSVSGNFIGYSPEGRKTMPNGAMGLLLSWCSQIEVGSEGATNNWPQKEFHGNIVSGNASNGIHLAGCARVVLGANHVGVDEAGTNAVPNGGHGVCLASGSYNLVGSEDGADFNIISGNGGDGVHCNGGANGIIWCNFIGTGKNGIGNIPNASNGVHLAGGALNYDIGWPFEETPNFIGGNGRHGIFLDNGPQNNEVYHNYVGRGLPGMTFGPNGGAALKIYHSNPSKWNSCPNTIGGTEGLHPWNIFDGQTGVDISNAWAQTLVNNYIGFDPSQANASTVMVNGIVIQNGYLNEIGKGCGNYIGACRDAGIVLNMSTNPATIFWETGNTIQGNLIGCATNLGGYVTNAGVGLLAREIANDIIGNITNPNWIANSATGIVIESANGTMDGLYPARICGNRVGIAPNVNDGSAGNRSHGIALKDCRNLRVGTTNLVDHDVSSGNLGDGIRLERCDSVSVSGYRVGIGTNVLAAIPNAGNGITILNSTNCLLGSTDAIEVGNTIAANAGHGVAIGGGQGQTLLANLIGRVSSGGISVPGNGGDGVLVVDSINALIGSSMYEGNTIVSNNGNGLRIVGSASEFPTILDNVFEMNQSNGIHLVHVPDAVIGGTRMDGGNHIRVNRGHGIVMENVTNAMVYGNLIGVYSDDEAGPNGGDGIFVTGGGGNVFGNDFTQNINQIGGNAGNGIRLSSTFGNRLRNCRIGCKYALDGTVPNAGHGVLIENGSQNNIVDSYNIIGGNALDGVRIEGASTRANVIRNAVIGTNSLGNGQNGIRLVANENLVVRNTICANTLNGIEISGGDRNLIGDNAETNANVVSGNLGHGVSVYVGANNRVGINRIVQNGLMAINLETSGVTPNDYQDADTGPNMVQNFAVLTNVFRGSTHIQGTFNSRPNGLFRLDFYSSSLTNSNGGQMDFWLGTSNVICDANGDAALAMVLPRTATLGHWVVCTATDTNNNTSELSWPVVVNEAPDPNNYGVPDVYRAEYTNLVYTEAGQACTNDYDRDGFSDRDEWIAGTNPEDPDSLLEVWPGSVEIPDTSEGRLYTIEQSTNLPAHAWTYVEGSLGTGSNLVFDIERISPSAAYRARAALP